MAGGSYGRSTSLSDSLTNALLIRSFAPREMRPSGSYLSPSNSRSPGWGRWFSYLVVLKSVRERPSIRSSLRSATESPRRFDEQMSPQTAEAATPRDLPGAWWVYVTALLTGSPRVRQKGCLGGFTAISIIAQN